MRSDNGARSRLLLSGASLIAASTLASRLLGLFRDRLFASLFGAGPVLDAYFAAYRIPDLLFNLLILGTLSAAFLPVFSSYVAKGPAGRKEAFTVAHSILTLTTLVLAACALVLLVLAPAIIPILAPGFDAERRQDAVLLSRIMLLQPLLLGVSSVLGGVLTSFGRFFAYAAAPVLYNAGIILGTLLFVPRLGIAGLGWGVVLGACLHLLVQVPAAWRLGFHFRPDVRIHAEGLRQMRRLVIPRLVGLLAGQAGLLVVTVVGSLLAAGSIVVFTFAENLQAVPVGIIGVSFAVAAFPQLSEAAARSAAGDFLGTLVRSIRLVLFFVLPLSLSMLLLRAQLVRVVLGTGQFDPGDVQRTFSVLGVLVVSVFAQSLIPLLARAFFALHDTRTPMGASVIAIIVNIVSALLLARGFGVVGLAAAFALASIVHFLLLLTFLHARLGGLRDRELLSAVFRIGVATLFAGVAIQLLKFPLAALLDVETPLGVLVQLFGAGLSGALAFWAVSFFLGLEELRLLRDMIVRAWRAAQ